MPRTAQRNSRARHTNSLSHIKNKGEGLKNAISWNFMKARSMHSQCISGPLLINFFVANKIIFHKVHVYIRYCSEMQRQ